MRASSHKTIEPSLSLKRRLLKEAVLITMIALSFFFLIAIFSYHVSDSGWSHVGKGKEVLNMIGPVGAWLADFNLSLFGYIAYLFPFIFLYIGWAYFKKHRRIYTERYHAYFFFCLKTLGILLAIFSASAILSIFARVHDIQSLSFNAGGMLGIAMSAPMLSTFHRMGAVLILFPCFLIGVTLFTNLSWVALLENTGMITHRLIRSLFAYVSKIPWQSYIHYYRSIFKKKNRPLTTDSLLQPRIQATLPVSDVLAEDFNLLVVDSPIVSMRPPVDLSNEVSASFRNAPRFKGSGILPKLALLGRPEKKDADQFSKIELQERSREVELHLQDFGVAVNVVAVYPGPVVTRFELSLAAGTKVSKISNLYKDLARSLSVTSVRIVEVIPGKSVIGLELPNKNRELVTLYEILVSQPFQHARSSLTLALGKDIAGHPVVADLAKMPHLLVAGTTGSGKSVSLNAMLLSLLFKSTPQQLRLIMIDPKMLELAIYDGIPHLLTPVVTDMKDAAAALRWCVGEMERRYRLMASLGVRNIAGYNDKVTAAKEKGTPLLDPLRKTDNEEAIELQTLPKIVVIADEFADMMVVVGKKVETLIVRLAQKARAAGIHLVFATQRPSVDVITGLIKANIPTRIALQVASKVDSRTILDQQGAEQLLGHGDMLYLAPGAGVPMRVHGPYVDDEEVHRVIADLKDSAAPDYIEGVLDNNMMDVGSMSAGYGSLDESDGEKDEFYDQAVEAVVQSRKVSVSSIQRRFKIGYNRAARIVDAMEAAGIVSAMGNNGGRDVLILKREAT